MISFAVILLDQMGNEQFDIPLLRERVQSLPWAQNFREFADGVHASPVAFECELQDGNTYAPLPLWVPKEGTSLHIGKDRLLGLRAALQLQESYGRDFFAVTEESLPDIIAMRDVKTAEELAEKLELSYGPEVE